MPAISTPPVIAPAPSRRWLWLFLFATVLIPCAFVLAVLTGITSLFHLGSEARALHSSLLASSGTSYQPRVTLNLGWCSLGTARRVASFFAIAPEARAAMRSLRAAEVSVGELRHGARPPDYALMLAAADRAMTARGWERVVGAIQEGKLAAFYTPSKGNSSKRVRCCMVASDGHYLVLVAAKTNLEPLIELVSKEQPWRFN